MVVTCSASPPTPLAATSGAGGTGSARGLEGRVTVVTLVKQKLVRN